MTQSHPLSRLLSYRDRYRRQVWLASLCSVLNKVFDLAPPALIGLALDVVVQQQDSLIARWGIPSIRGQFIALAILTFVIWGLESVFEYFYKTLWRNLAQSLQHHLRLDAYGHLQGLDLAYFENRSSGSLMAVLNDDINQLERFLDHGANQLLQLATTALIIGAAFFILAPSMAWMAILPMPFVVWGAIAFQKRLAPRYAEVRERVSLLNSRLSNNISGITTIKSFTAETYETERIRQESEAYRQSNRHAIALSAAFIPLIRIIILIGFTAILLYGGLAAVAGELAVSTYSVLVFLTQRLLWPLTSLGETLDEYQRAMASTQRVMNLLETSASISAGTQPLPKGKVRGEIWFEDITFAYEARHPVVQHLTLKVPAGKTVALVGATGSGKSTLVKLLMQFYQAQQGRILLDGQDLRSLDPTDLRQAIGWVSQDVFLFHGTVAENIAYGSFDATLAEIQQAAQMAEADEFIQQLPAGYDTLVGERGQKLSGGQRQRLAIARAILKDPPILILDEATSAVDNETEAAIQRALEKITQNRTTIAIAHRLSTVRNTDRIYVMAQGQLIEWGTHAELLARQGVYAGFWKIQMGE
ncbi:ABC transporter ATP-binding protein [Romeria aff. gracilis LEGE 07310]|uniref:ABC transporter ATP-binding protein n=1 Tax=Vasconcelosia minhoensis LEGE 07310 TaxID=915328 RepID=A0A8J7DBL3_9CYAN|nr:ABC transporter ATP-binding protein [Romeria gracilis]MBE9077887.1 ABC transporter ATP-binding protein [Romeria aff. gracilis LEGE 07310]